MFFKGQLNTVAKAHLLSESAPTSKSYASPATAGLLGYIVILSVAIIGAALVAHFG